MDLHELAKNRVAFIAVLSIGVLVILGVVLVIINSFLTKNPYGTSTDIPGYDSLIQNLSPDYKNDITSQLYATLKLNNPNGPDPSTVKDVVIRTSSVKQDIITSQKEYSGSFIIDIESLKQSYKISYVYSTDPNDPILGGYPVTVSCLEASDLIYGSFDCKTTFNPNTQASDPVLNILPYSTLDYEIAAKTDSSGKVTSLEVQISLSDADYKTGVDQVVAARKQEVLDWLKSKEIDPSKYTINYSY